MWDSKNSANRTSSIQSGKKLIGECCHPAGDQQLADLT